MSIPFPKLKLAMGVPLTVPTAKTMPVSGAITPITLPMRDYVRRTVMLFGMKMIVLVQGCVLIVIVLARLAMVRRLRSVIRVKMVTSS